MPYDEVTKMIENLLDQHSGNLKDPDHLQPGLEEDIQQEYNIRFVHCMIKEQFVLL